jgi:hypothetical protein
MVRGLDLQACRKTREVFTQMAGSSQDPSRVTVKRVRRNKGHESISRDSLQDRRLSFKARGIMGYLQSLPDEWDVNGAQGLADVSDKDGYYAVNEGIRELEEVGLFARLKRQAAGGRWEWLWVHSDDPADVAAAVEEWVSQGGQPPSPRRGPRAPQPGPRPGDDPGDQATTVLQFSVHGQPVDGSPADGEPRNKEVYSEIYSKKEIPGGESVNARASDRSPTAPPPSDLTEEPPGVYDPANPRCRAHLLVPAAERGPNCGACARTREWQAAKDQAAVVEAARALRECCMCDADGKRTDRYRAPLSPYRSCDHLTPTETVLAEIAAAEAELDRPRAPIATTPASSESARAAALTAYRQRASRRGMSAGNTLNGFLNPADSGHTDHVQARTG